MLECRVYTSHVPGTSTSIAQLIRVRKLIIAWPKIVPGRRLDKGGFTGRLDKGGFTGRLDKGGFTVLFMEG